MRKRADETLDIPIVPLIDVVVELIIFFVLTGMQQNELIDDTIKLAQASVPAVKQMEKLSLIINIHEDGKVNVALEEISLSKLKNMCKSLVSQYGNMVPVVVRCDERALYKEADKVMAAIGEAGLYRVRIAAVHAGGEK